MRKKLTNLKGIMILINNSYLVYFIKKINNNIEKYVWVWSLVIIWDYIYF